MVVNEESKIFPNIYWTPKLHKHTFKARFVITVPQCLVKCLSESVHSANRKQIISKWLTFQELNHFGQRKAASLLMIQLKNSTVEIKHHQLQLITFKFSIHTLKIIN